MSFFNPFRHVLFSDLELLTLPLEDLCVETVRSIETGLVKHTIHTYHNLTCLKFMRRDAPLRQSSQIGTLDCVASSHQNTWLQVGFDASRAVAVPCTLFPLGPVAVVKP